MLRILDFARSLLNLPSLFLSFLQNMQLSEVCQRDIYQRTLKKKKVHCDLIWQPFLAQLKLRENMKRYPKRVFPVGAIGCLF